MGIEIFYEIWSSRMLSVVRIVVALLFLEHGTAKLFGFPRLDMFANIQIFSLIGVAGILEVAGSLLIFLGLATRLAAFALSGEMAIGYFMVHAPHGFLPLLNQGEAAAFYCVVFLYFAVSGGGTWSLDNLMQSV